MLPKRWKKEYAMQTVALPSESENLLINMIDLNLCRGCSLDTLRRVMRGAPDVEESLGWLVDFGFVYFGESGYELTAAGVETAHELQAKAQGSFLNDAPIREAHSPADTYENIPLLDTHPLRSASLHQTGTLVPRNALHYVLAFMTPNNALPAPVLDGDVLGRVADADICLRHDDFISGRHCRFMLRQEGDTPVLGIVDLGSRNGTFVDGFQLEAGEFMPLTHGSRVQVGCTELIVIQIPY